MRKSKHWVTALCCLAVLAKSACAGELRMGVPFPEDSQELTAVRKATADIDKATRTQVKITLSLFRPNEEGLAKKILDGELDGGLVMPNDIADLHPDALVYAIPFTFTSYEQVDYVRRHLDAEILQKISTPDSPYTALAIVEFGFAYVMSSQSVASPDEWGKRKIWIPGEGEFSKFLGDLGLKAVPLPLAGVRAGLGDGTVDTVIAPLPVAIFQRWHTKTKKVFAVPFVYTYGIWIVRNDAITKLSADEQKTVRERLSSCCQELSTALRTRNDKGRGVLESYGHEFVAPDAVMQKQWGQWAEAVWKNLGENHKPTAEIEGKLKEQLSAFDNKGKK